MTGTADNIIHYANDGDDSTTDAYSITFGINVTSSGAKYVYDSSTGYGEITENVNVYSVNADTIADAIGLKQGDVIKSLVVNGTEKAITRTFNLSDIALTLRAGDSVSFVVERDGETVTTSSHTLVQSDFHQI